MKTVNRSLLRRCLCYALTGLLIPGISFLCMAQSSSSSASIRIDWNKTILVSRSTPTLQVVVNPMLREGSPIHDAAFRALKQMNADTVRYVPWFPYPKLVVAELNPPTATTTSWDFSLIDPMTKDFLAATAGHTTVMNFSTIPVWMFRTSKPVSYPQNPNQVDWDYNQGTELLDPTGKQVGDYYARLVSWYTRGGFTDELGQRHVSGYHYHFPVWEVLNEVDFEHSMTPEQYTLRYDAIVQAIHSVSPDTKFMGLALAHPATPHWFEYFLNPKNHKPGIPLDYISYHFYASPKNGETPDTWQTTFFQQADDFLKTVRGIQQTRQRLSPKTETDVDEIGVILPDDNQKVADADGYISSIPKIYWNAAAALYAYVYMGLSQQGIEWIGESQLVGYPSQFPSVTMIDWVNGKPNARYWVLQLLRENLHPGDRIVDAHMDGASGISAEAFQTSTVRKLLLVNRKNQPQSITLPNPGAISSVIVVDAESGEAPPQNRAIHGANLQLAPFAVTVVKWK